MSLEQAEELNINSSIWLQKHYSCAQHVERIRQLQAKLGYDQQEIIQF